MKRALAITCAALAAVGIMQVPAAARERIHFIAAQEISWDYAPQGKNVISGRPLFPIGSAQLGWTYHKIVYREYTDATFTTQVKAPATERYMGLVGPTIHAEVGDTVVIVFRNLARLPLDIAPNGVDSYPRPAAVNPSTTRTFRWPITATDGPGLADLSSIVFTYASDTQQSADENAGLIGALVVTRRGSARADGSPNDVDQEVVTLFSTQKEVLNPLLGVNLGDHIINPKGVRRSARGFIDANAFASINGYIYGNMPLPVLRLRDRVRWYVLSTLNDFDGHAPTWSGQTVLFDGNRTDSIGLSTSHATAEMVPDNLGIWLLYCSNGVHLFAGMEARFEVVP